MFRVTDRGGQVVEGMANALSRRAIGYLLAVEERTVDSLSQTLYRRLDIPKGVRRRGCRSIGMFIAAGVLTKASLKLPGKPFTFTMKLPEGHTNQNPIVKMPYDYSASAYGTGRSLMMPKASDEHLGSVTLTAKERTYMSCIGWGMTVNQIGDDSRILGKQQACRNNLARINKKLGVLNYAHALAHAALEGFVTFGEDILEPGAPFNPTVYTESITLDIARERFSLSNLWPGSDLALPPKRDNK